MSVFPRVGILGCGVITQRTMPGLIRLLEDAGAELIAGADVDPNNVAAVDALTPQRTLERYSGLEAMLDRSSADAILVATPIALHAQHVAAVLSAGRHVYCHKTLAPSAEDCRALARTAETAGLRLAASPGQILLPAYARAQEILRSGELGTLVSVDAVAEAAAHRFEQERAPEDPPDGTQFSWEWYHRKSSGGGPLDDMFVYPLAFLTELLGPPTAAAVKGRLVEPRIAWRGRVIAADATDAYAGLLMFGETPATIRSSFSANTARVPWGFVTLRGTAACLEIEKCNDLEYRLHLTPNEGPARIETCHAFSAEEADAYGSKECHVLTDIRELLSALREERQVVGATAHHAARVADGLALIKASAVRGGAWTQEEGLDTPCGSA